MENIRDKDWVYYCQNVEVTNLNNQLQRILSKSSNRLRKGGRKFLNRLETILNNKIEKKLSSQLKKVKIDKINAGCGDTIINGWLNVDLYPGKSFPPYGSLIKNENGAMLLNFDLTKELPISENTVNYIYSSHFIEHMTFRDGIVFLERCHKIMKKGGIIRITFPDLELFIKNYYENNTDFFNKYRLFRENESDMEIIKTKGEIIMQTFSYFGHKCVYDFESMKHIMEKAGFINIAKRKCFDSSIPEIEKIESGREARASITAYVEAEK